MAYTVEQHFEGRVAAVREIYDTILAVSSEFGPVEEDPKKTSIHLNRRSAFAGIQTRREYLILTVKSKGDINNARISKREQASANRWHCEIKLTSPADVDGQLIAWLRDSYSISS
jgi:hypothetical protein